VPLGSVFFKDFFHKKKRKIIKKNENNLEFPFFLRILLFFFTIFPNFEKFREFF